MLPHSKRKRTKTVHAREMNSHYEKLSQVFQKKEFIDEMLNWNLCIINCGIVEYYVHSFMSSVKLVDVCRYVFTIKASGVEIYVFQHCVLKVNSYSFNAL